MPPCISLPASGARRACSQCGALLTHPSNAKDSSAGRAWRCELSPNVRCAAAMARLSPGARSSIAAARGTCAK